MSSQIWKIMGCVKIQKFEYLENGSKLIYEIKKFLTCASYFEKLSFCSGGNLKDTRKMGQFCEMSSIFSKLQRDYYKCKTVLKTIADFV